MKNLEIQILHMSIWILIFKLVLVEVLFVLGFFLLKYVSSLILPEQLISVWMEENYLFLLVLHLAEVGFLIYISLLWSNTMYYFSVKNISVRTGIFSIKQDTYNTVNIESVKVRQSFLGILFRFGHLSLYAPTLKETILLRHVSNPKRVAKDIENYMEKSQSKIIPIPT